jgi:tetratricopeptide (TPR) repeat protein
MHKIFILFFLALSMCLACNNQKKAADVKQQGHIYSLRDAFDFQGEAMKAYNTNPKMASDRFLRAATAYVQNGYNKDAAICYGNAAHLYEEYLNNIDSAFLLSKLGLDYAIKANDTLNTGHGYRYTGYLMGVKNNTAEGIAQIEKSKPFYTLRNNKDAIAVADYDIARVYFMGKQYEKAIKNFNQSTNHFKNKMDVQRIFNNNLFALKMYKTIGNTQAYNATKLENDNLILSGKISEALKIMYDKTLK